MKIVIIGAGISGCAAYIALKKHLPLPAPPAEDHSYTIYEAHNTNKDTTTADRTLNLHSSTLIVGGGLGVAPNGLNVLRRLDPDILKDVTRGGYSISTFKMKSKHGRVLVNMESASKIEEMGSMNTVASSRDNLWRCLRTRVPDDIIVNKRITEVIASQDGRNIIKFADGSAPVQADLVIGADGVKSTVKRALFPEMKEEVYPHQYEGLVGIGGFVPSTPALRKHIDKGSMNFIFGGNGFFGYFYANSSPSSLYRDSPYHISEPGDLIAWWSTFAMDECPSDPRNIDCDAVRKELRERHSRWTDPVIQNIINGELKVESVYPTWTAPELPTWYRNGVVLIGDAAHALPSTSGQGSSQALEDVEAYSLFLAHELRNAYAKPLDEQPAIEQEAIMTAAKKYTNLRQPHVKKILDQARQMQNQKRNMSPIQEWIMYCFMWLMGFFPSVMTKGLRQVIQYNIEEEVEKVLRVGE
ncbi:putative extracellular salicylate hydroxylase/monooxygenase [Xylogone sp. PMI_703]|nr:putative extracellular salicylate hydroxylase/monooxygenase [Xylogone sp. PMI_703]